MNGSSSRVVWSSKQKTRFIVRSLWDSSVLLLLHTWELRKFTSPFLGLIFLTLTSSYQLRCYQARQDKLRAKQGGSCSWEGKPPENWEIQTLTFAMRICVTQVFLTFLSRRHPNQISKWTDFKWEKYMQANKTDLSVKCDVHAASLKGWRSCNNAFSSTDAPSPFPCAFTCSLKGPPVSNPAATYTFPSVSGWRGLPSIFSHSFLLSCLLSLTRL